MINNKVILIGRLTKDPEVRTAGENQVANFSIAVDKPYNKDKGHPEATFIDCVVWNGGAKFLEGYFGKGDVIGIEGRLDIRKWEDDDGNTRYKTEVVCDQISFVPGAKKRADNETQDTNDDDDDFPM